MESTAQFLLAIGGILLFGQLTSSLGRLTFLPRVTLLLIFGVILGKGVLDIIPTALMHGFDLIANMALLMVGFLLGGKLTSDYLRSSMGKILWISLSAAIVTACVVGLGLLWAGLPKEIALILGCISAATAPAAVLDVVMESEDKGPFGKLLLSVVALDDAWALILFGLGVSIVHSFGSQGAESSALILALKDIGGAVVLGIVIGFTSALLHCPPILAPAIFPTIRHNTYTTTINPTSLNWSRSSEAPARTKKITMNGHSTASIV